MCLSYHQLAATYTERWHSDALRRSVPGQLAVGHGRPAADTLNLLAGRVTLQVESIQTPSGVRT